jgi:hypothetical protein
MPIEWSADAGTRRVEAEASGTISVEDLAGFIEDMRRAGVLGHAKIVDFSHASLDIRASEVRSLARTINALAGDRGEALGPVAIVVASDPALDVFMLFDERTTASGRPLSIFASRRQASAWLDGAK